MITSEWIKKEELDEALFQLCLLDLLEKQTYDLIHAQDVVSALAISKVNRDSLPLMTTVHGLYSHELIADHQFEADCPETNYVLTRDRNGLAVSDRVIVASDYLRRRLLHEFDLAEQKAIVMANGLEMRPILEKKQKQPSQCLTIACPARLTKRKGHLVLLDALTQLRSKHAHFQCLIIGDGPMKSALMEYCEQKQLTKHVQFLGYRTDVDEILEQCDVVVLPTLNDNFPYTIMEGQAAQKVVIASEVGGIPEMIADYETGLLFPKEEAHVLAEKLQLIIEDAALKESIQRNAFQYANEHWHHRIFYHRMIKAYEQLERRE